MVGGGAYFLWSLVRRESVIQYFSLSPVPCLVSQMLAFPWRCFRRQITRLGKVLFCLYTELHNL